MKIESIEILLVLVIVCIQIYVFLRTWRKILLLKFVLPSSVSLKITRILIPISDLETLSPKVILKKIDSYKNDYNNTSKILSDGKLVNSNISKILGIDNNIQITKSEVNIIEADTRSNYVFNNILNSINNYLIRNRSAATDFNLVKDIVERNIIAVDDDVNSSIGIPLYLGLMGTMIGIIIGLFNMPELGAIINDTKEMDLKLNEGIGMLIGGVKIAMIASFFGLLFTIIHSGWLYKGSRRYCEERKNDFYTFIQIELLPLINQGMASTLESLQRNLIKFNNEFSVNLNGLSGIFESSRSAIREQKELLDAIDKAKVSEITRHNVTVLKQLDLSVSQFVKFNSYLNNVNKFVENSNNIVFKANELLARTNNFKKIADNIESKLDISQKLMEFLNTHFENLEAHKEFTTNTVADVGHSISDSFKELKEHIQNSSEAVKKFTIDETDLLKKTLSESKTNLGNLEHLVTLKSDLSQFKNSSASQGERLKQSIDELNKNMSKSIFLLEQIEKKSHNNSSNNISTSIRRLFKFK